jgi:hypothetical protein
MCSEGNEKEEKKIMTATKAGEGTFPVVTVKVNSITCRALIDSGAGSSYASAKLVGMLNQKQEWESRHVNELSV